MGTYASTTDVQARLAGRTIDSNSKPSTTQVGYWIDEAEAMLTGALKAAQCTTPVTDSDGLKVMRSWVCDYAEGHTRQAFVATGADGNDDGERLIQKFFDLLDDIDTNPSRYVAMLSGGTAGDSARRMRSHITDNSDSLTVEDGDFDPLFEFDNTDPSEIF